MRSFTATFARNPPRASPAKPELPGAAVFKVRRIFADVAMGICSQSIGLLFPRELPSTAMSVSMRDLCTTP